MAMFLCKLWPFLFGGLIGWFSCGIFARKLKYAQRPIQQIVDSSHAATKATRTEKRVEVIKEIDNPAHLKRIAELEAQLASAKESKPNAIGASTFQDQSPSESASKINKANTQSIAASFLADDDMSIDNLGKNDSSSNTEALGLVSSTEETSQPSDNSETRSEGSTLKASTVGNASAGIDKSAAKAAGFKVKGDNDFTVVEGIGPKINQLLHDAGVETYQQLSEMNADAIQKILNEAGSRFSLAKPGSWPKQASYAARNNWNGLKELQDQLDGGV